MMVKVMDLLTSEDNRWLIVTILPVAVMSFGIITGAQWYHTVWKLYPQLVNYPDEVHFFLTLMYSFIFMIAVLCIYHYRDDVSFAMSNMKSVEEKLGRVRRAKQFFITVAISILAIVLISAIAIEQMFTLRYLNSLHFYILLGFYAIIAGIMIKSYYQIRNVVNVKYKSETRMEMNLDLLWFITLAVSAMLTVFAIDALKKAYQIEYSFAKLYPDNASFLFFLVWSLVLMGAFLVCLSLSRDLKATESDAESRKLLRRVFAKMAVSSLAAILVTAYLTDHTYQIQFFNSLPFYGVLGVYGIITFGIYMLYKYVLDVARGRWS
jgi:MFS family permease